MEDNIKTLKKPWLNMRVMAKYMSLVPKAISKKDLEVLKKDD